MMQEKTLFILIVLVCLAVFVILATGIRGFAKGGEADRRNGNRIMRWRIIAQAIAVALIMLLIWIRAE